MNIKEKLKAIFLALIGWGKEKKKGLDEEHGEMEEGLKELKREKESRTF